MILKHYGKGNSEVLLLLHGENMSSWVWQGVANQLANKFHCIAVDLPSHGTNADKDFDLEDTVQLLSRLISQILPNKKIFIAGVGLGAQIALKLAYNHTYLVKGVILNGIKIPNKTSSIGQFGDSLVSVFKRGDDYLIHKMNKSGIPLMKLTKFKQDWESVSDKNRKKISQDMKNFQLAEDVLEIKMPVLLTYGSEEPSSSKLSAEEVATYFAASQKVEISEGKEYWIIEKPKVFAQLMERFMISYYGYKPKQSVN